MDMISRTEIADLLGVTGERVSQLASEGTLPQADKQGRYPGVRSLVAVAKLLKDRASVADAKRANLEKKNRLLDIAIKKADAQALDAVAVEKAWANLVLLCKGRLLRIPSKASPRLAYCTGERAIEEELRKEIDEALSELARTPDYS